MMQYMPHVSKKKLSQKVEEQLLKTLKTAFTKINKSEDMDKFLFSFLSKTEQLMLAKRLAIAVLLEENIPESTIANILNVTRETVARQRYQKELRGEGYKIAFGKLSEEKILSEFKKFLISLARYSVRAAGGYVKPRVI